MLKIICLCLYAEVAYISAGAQRGSLTYFLHVGLQLQHSVLTCKATFIIKYIYMYFKSECAGGLLRGGSKQ